MDAGDLVGLLDLLPHFSGEIVNRNDREDRQCPASQGHSGYTNCTDEPCDPQTGEHGIILNRRRCAAKIDSKRPRRVSDNRVCDACLG